MIDFSGIARFTHFVEDRHIAVAGKYIGAAGFRTPVTPAAQQRHVVFFADLEFMDSEGVFPEIGRPCFDRCGLKTEFDAFLSVSHDRS